MEFLLMLVDEAESGVISKVTAQLDLRSLENNTGLIIDSSELCSDKRAVSLAALSFRMVQILYDRNEAVDNKELQDSFKICESNCQNKIAHIEVTHKKQLHTVILIYLLVTCLTFLRRFISPFQQCFEKLFRVIPHEVKNSTSKRKRRYSSAWKSL